MSNNGTGAVFVQTNEADANRVIAFLRGAGGALHATEGYETGGRGDGVPHLTSQGSVVLTGDGDTYWSRMQEAATSASLRLPWTAWSWCRRSRAAVKRRRASRSTPDLSAWSPQETARSWIPGRRHRPRAAC